MTLFINSFFIVALTSNLIYLKLPILTSWFAQLSALITSRRLFDSQVMCGVKFFLCSPECAGLYIFNLNRNNQFVLTLMPFYYDPSIELSGYLSSWDRKGLHLLRPVVIEHQVQNLRRSVLS